ncbi:hypothetical protein F4802DRAFT_363511 [Xylaria palmicola]|nr:hypothetical protein F4802DRAFT_363511 [Xylaria palmicola]
MSFSPPQNECDALFANAPEDVVREVLIALCQDTAQEIKAIDYYHKLNKLRLAKLQTKDESDENKNNDDGVNDKRPNKRKAVSEVRLCLQCDQAFMEDDNPPDACQYHPGSVERDEDASVWDYMDDPTVPLEYDPTDEELCADHPESFAWDCCDKPSDSPGCARDPHKALYKKPQRQGLSDRDAILIS